MGRVPSGHDSLCSYPSDDDHVEAVGRGGVAACAAVARGLGGRSPFFWSPPSSGETSNKAWKINEKED